MTCSAAGAARRRWRITSSLALIDWMIASESSFEEITAAIARDETALGDPALYTRNPAKFAALTKAIEAARAEKDAAEERWLELAELVEG